MIKHFYKKIDGWFNMENQYKKLLDHVPINGTFVELGCWKGKSTAFLLTELINSKLPKNIIVVDNFIGSDKTEVERIVYKDIQKDQAVKEFLKNISPVKDALLQLFIQDSDIAAENFLNNSVDVIFIDAGHSFENVSADIKAWFPKIKKGGIMAGHDYNESWPGVIEAVNSLLGKENITIENSCWFYKV